MDIKDIEGKRVFWSNKWDKLWLLIFPGGFLITIFTRDTPPFWFWTTLVLASSFIIYVLFHMFHPKFVWVDTSTKQGEEIQKKAFELLLKTNGIFEYANDGFYFTDKQEKKFIAWADIESIFAYKKDLHTVDELNMDVITKNKLRLHLTEETLGWYQFISKIKETFPTIDKSFDINLMFPPFDLNMTLVYDSLNRTLEEAIKLHFEER